MKAVFTARNASNFCVSLFFIAAIKSVAICFVSIIFKKFLSLQVFKFKRIFAKIHVLIDTSISSVSEN